VAAKIVHGRYLAEPIERDLAAADAWQISATAKKDDVTPDGIRVAPAPTFLRSLI
jgi:hypothetical protein